MTIPLTPRADRLRRLYGARRRIEAEIALLLAAEPDPPTPRGICGTESGYGRHRRAGEAPCDVCREAHAARERIYYRRRKLREAS